jgi:hypothetical protein
VAVVIREYIAKLPRMVTEARFARKYWGMVLIRFGKEKRCRAEQDLTSLPKALSWGRFVVPVTSVTSQRFPCGEDQSWNTVKWLCSGLNTCPYQCSTSHSTSAGTHHQMEVTTVFHAAAFARHRSGIRSCINLLINRMLETGFLG